MALVSIPGEQRVLQGHGAVKAFLCAHAIEYDRVQPGRFVSPDAPAGELLDAYRDTINELKARYGQVTADVVDVFPDTPDLEAMLNRFNSEHFHDEDEVRFVVDGRGLLHVRPAKGAVFAIEIGPGDFIRLPPGMYHWFDLCAERRLREIRLFKGPADGTPRYTRSGVDQKFLPICFGPFYFPPGRPGEFA